MGTHPEGTGTGLAPPSRALVPSPLSAPSPGRMQTGWLLVSFPTASFLCVRSFGTYLLPHPKDPHPCARAAALTHLHQAPLKKRRKRRREPTKA